MTVPEQSPHQDLSIQAAASSSPVNPTMSTTSDVRASLASVEPTNYALNPLSEPLKNSLNSIGLRLTDQGFSEEDISKQLSGMTDIAISNNITNPEEIIKKYFLSEDFTYTTDEAKDKFQKIYQSYAVNDPDPLVESDLQGRLELMVAQLMQNTLNSLSQSPAPSPEKSTDQSPQASLESPASVLSNSLVANNSSPTNQAADQGAKDLEPPKDSSLADQPSKDREDQLLKKAQAAFRQQELDQAQNQSPITLSQALGHGVMSLINKFSDKGKKVGQGFSALQDAGNGLGMNNPNMDPVFLADKALDRLEKSSDALSLLALDAEPKDIALAKAGVLEAAENAQRYMGNENRSQLVKILDGSSNEFDASDSMSKRLKKFNGSIEKSKNSPVAAGDVEFDSKLSDVSSKTEELIKQMLESIKSAISTVFGMAKTSTIKPGQ